MRVYLLEGPDGAGKTTLLGELVKWLTNRGRRVQAIHHGPYKGEDQIGWRFFASMKAALVERSDVILDRCWLSDDVYGPAFRKTSSRISAAERQMLERAGLTCGAIVLRCDPGLDNVLRCWHGRQAEEYVTDETAMRAVHEGYKTLGLLHPFATHVWDYTTDTYKGFFDGLRRLEELIPPCPYPLAGQYNAPKVVLLAEKANHKTFARPFFSFLRTGCSWWLAEQLSAAGIHESALLWSNTLDVNGDEYEAALTRPLDVLLSEDEDQPIVLLGATAKRWYFDRYGNRGRVITGDHPMYWKRFHHTEPYPLVAALKELAR